MTLSDGTKLTQNTFRRFKLSIRARVLLMLLLLGVGTNVAFFLLWKPRLETFLLESTNQQTGSQLADLSDGLLPFLIQNQIAAIHETLDVVKNRHVSWVQLELVKGDGKLLYPLVSPEPVEGEDFLHIEHHIELRGNRIGTLSAVVDFGPTRAVLHRESLLLTGISTGLLFLSMVIIVTFLEIIVGARVRRLSQAAEQLSHGNYQISLPEVTQDEVGQLVESFDRMRDTVRDNERSLIDARVAAENASQSKSQFLATMSHEIRTPMNGVISMTDFMLETQLTPTQEHYTKTIRRSGEALLGIIDDILDFSRLESGNMELRSHRFDLTDLVEEVLDLMSGQGFERGLELASYVSPDVAGHYLGDDGRLRQVLLNLVGNAIKFTESGYITVEVVRADNTGDDRGFEIRVTDTGIGIDAKDLESIFKRFSQVDTSRSRRYEGTGLGLAISHHIVEAMGGSISVDSKPGEGSVFRIRLDLPRPDSEAAPQAEIRADSIRNALLVCKRGNCPTSNLLARTLEDMGIRCTRVANTSRIQPPLDREADTIDLIILDEARLAPSVSAEISDVRNAVPGSEVPIIVSAPSLKSQWDEWADAIPNLHFLPKPIKFHALRRAIGNLGGEDSRSLEGDIANRLRSRIAARSAVSQESDASRAFKVLVADDNQINREVAQALLGGLGHSVDVVEDGREAVAAVGRGNYDVVFMDVRMPNMDGLEATRAIRALDGTKSALPVIGMTANAFTEDRESCLDAGMNAYLAKPVKRELVATTLAEVMPPAG